MMGARVALSPMPLRGSKYTLVVITLLLGAISYYASNMPERQMEEGRWVAHTHEVLDQLAMLSVLTTQAQDQAHAGPRAA